MNESYFISIDSQTVSNGDRSTPSSNHLLTPSRLFGDDDVVNTIRLIDQFERFGVDRTTAVEGLTELDMADGRVVVSELLQRLDDVLLSASSADRPAAFSLAVVAFQQELKNYKFVDFFSPSDKNNSPVADASSAC